MSWQRVKRWRRFCGSSTSSGELEADDALVRRFLRVRFRGQGPELTARVASFLQDVGAVMHRRQNEPLDVHYEGGFGLQIRENDAVGVDPEPCGLTRAWTRRALASKRSRWVVPWPAASNRSDSAHAGGRVARRSCAITLDRAYKLAQRRSKTWLFEADESGWL